MSAGARSIGVGSSLYSESAPRRMNTGVENDMMLGLLSIQSDIGISVAIMSIAISIMKNEKE